MASRPAVLPETYSGEGSFSEWADHFDSVAEVNGWDDAAKALWLRVRLVGRAQSVFKRFAAADRTDYAKARKLLKERFEPDSKCALYEAEFQARRKQPTEDWAAFGEDLKTLADKAFPELEEAAKEHLAVSHFLTQLDAQLAFSVRQKKPKTISSAVASTQELESYRLAPHNTAPLQQVAPREPSFVDAVQAKQDAMMDLIQQLVTRIETLEKELKRQSKRPGIPQTTSPTAVTPRTNSPVVCRRCGKEGHYARGCAAPRRTTPPAQGNE